jgi:chitinase
MKRFSILTAAGSAAVVAGALLVSTMSPVSAASASRSSGLRAVPLSAGTAAPEPGGQAKSVQANALAAATTCAAAWSATATYVGGDVVTYGGHTWTAKWWTYGDIPGGAAGVWTDGGACGTTPPPTTVPPTTVPPTTVPPTTVPPTTVPPTTNPPTAGSRVVGYFTEWGIYGRNYQVKNIETSGSASKLNTIVYAFGNTTGGQCSVGDSYADYDKAYTAADSVDGVADTWDAGALRGNFGQLRRLKKMHPGLKVLWSFGGWTWSGGFTQAAANPAAFANSCYSLVKDSRWSDVFDGIDIDWEYPNACGLQCDTSGREGYKNLIAALRSKFGSSALITSAITADGTSGGKIDAADYAGAAQYLNWFDPMTYDYYGAFNPTGPTAPHSPLTNFAGAPNPGFDSATAIAKLKSAGIPASKLLLGIGFYGRGWTGVTQNAPGGTATGAAPGTYEAGIEDYKVLKTRCPATGTVGGTAYARCGSEWWSYDTPATIAGKMSYAKQQGLGGSFFWELSGDTANGELITALKNGLS